jgi:hypothetical protein
MSTRCFRDGRPVRKVYWSHSTIPECWLPLESGFTLFPKI